MSQVKRTILCLAMLATGLAAQAALERVNETDRPALRSPLASIPLQLGEWVGADQTVHPDLVQRAQTTDYLSRVYESPRHPGLKLHLWMNYSRYGANLRHTPEICLPSVGYTKLESHTRELKIPVGDQTSLQVTRLGYSLDELVEHVGFWYYIFGEGKLENYVRRLPITSRSSHGRTTRGSSMTVEVFYPGDLDPEGRVLREFVQELVQVMEPILPTERATYHIP
jgi:EpsI family protein